MAKSREPTCIVMKCGLSLACTGETFAVRKTNAMIQVRSDIELGGIRTAFIRAISLCQPPQPPT